MRSGAKPLDPAAGSDANRAVIEAVHTCYGQLYLQNPHFQWAGMASMIDPWFATEFLDLDALRDFAVHAGGILERVPGPARSSNRSSTTTTRTC